MAKKTDTTEKKEQKAEAVKSDIKKLKLNEAKALLENIRMDLVNGKENDTSKLIKIRKHIARLLTKQNETK